MEIERKLLLNFSQIFIFFPSDLTSLLVSEVMLTMCHLLDVNFIVLYLPYVIACLVLFLICVF